MQHVTIDDIRRTIDIVNEAIVNCESAIGPNQKQAALKRAFVATCRFLRKLLASDFFDDYAKLIQGLEPGFAHTLGDLAADHPALAILHEPEKFEEFLTFERELLMKAGFAPDLSADIVQAVRQAYEELFREDFTVGGFCASITSYKDLVCDEGEKTPRQARDLFDLLGGFGLVAVDAGTLAVAGPAAPLAVPIMVALSGAVGGAFASRAIGAVPA